MAEIEGNRNYGWFDAGQLTKRSPVRTTRNVVATTDFVGVERES
ncbi:MAG: hypothetical protein V1736_06795 [Pseudomonadota bacterium]